MIRNRLITIVRTVRDRPALITGFALLLALVSGFAGYMLAAGSRGEQTTADSPDRRILYWYDPMVPGERYPGPGKSSMGMELIPKYADEAGAGGAVRVSAEVRQNLGVRTARVAFGNLSPSISAVGRVEVDERRIAEVQTLTPGFVEQLAVRAVGEPVGRGMRVATVYSPELYGAQQEYVALLNIRSSAITPGLKQAARQRLALLGLPQGAIRSLERSGEPQRSYAVFAPRSGVVTAIGARPGAKVEPGQSIVTLADISQVWVVAEVPEASMGQVRVGQPAVINFPAYAEEPRPGRIDYIFPTLDLEARTGRVRVTLANPGVRLKIGMFAQLSIAGTPTGGLVVPAEAVISTGKRNVVIVQRNNGFIPVEVEPGRTVGDMTEIRRGLAPNDIVVVSGQFLIDSEASLAGLIERLRRVPPSGSKPSAPAPAERGNPQPAAGPTR
ncbi:MAG: efflux RND transporter periplasmic adaptor subunit [Qipengyuania sp.]|nr:efflux RND transporter periplasmic adaptor subunit [Qipengyuania sp.]